MEIYGQIAQWTGWPILAAAMLLAGGYWVHLLNGRLEYQKEINAHQKDTMAQMEKELGKRNTSAKPIKHYLLFWWRAENAWAEFDWNAATDYIARFQPACGFSRFEASHSEMVTIVGSAHGVDADVERWLEDCGCKVERLDGHTREDTAELLKERVRAGKAFEGGAHRRGYS